VDDHIVRCPRSSPALAGRVVTSGKEDIGVVERVGAEVAGAIVGEMLVGTAGTANAVNVALTAELISGVGVPGTA
jgi:hypothetical protein